LRHAREVGFEKIPIEQQRGRGDLIFREHRSIMRERDLIYDMACSRTAFPLSSQPR
jgi:hypothetical protein